MFLEKKMVIKGFKSGSQTPHKTCMQLPRLNVKQNSEAHCGGTSDLYTAAK